MDSVAQTQGQINFEKSAPQVTSETFIFARPNYKRKD